MAVVANYCWFMKSFAMRWPFLFKFCQKMHHFVFSCMNHVYIVFYYHSLVIHLQGSITRKHWDWLGYMRNNVNIFQWKRIKDEDDNELICFLYFIDWFGIMWRKDTMEGFVWSVICSTDCQLMIPNLCYEKSSNILMYHQIN